MSRTAFIELALGTFLTLVLTGILAEQNRNVRLAPAPYYGTLRAAAVPTTPSCFLPIAMSATPAHRIIRTASATATTTLACRTARIAQRLTAETESKMIIRRDATRRRATTGMIARTGMPATAPQRPPPAGRTAKTAIPSSRSGSGCRICNSSRSTARPSPMRRPRTITRSSSSSAC